MTPLSTTRFSALYLFFTLILFGLTAQAQTTIAVSSTADSGPGTLREAITTANGNTALTYLITLPANQTITLTAALPDITFSGTIAGGSTLCPATGVGGSTIARTGSTPFRLLNLAGINKTLAVADLTFLNGQASTGTTGGAVQIVTSHNLTVQRCVFRANRAPAGGAISIDAPVTLIVEDSYFDENTASLPAGTAIYAATSGNAIRIDRTTFRQVANLESSDDNILYFEGASSVLLRNCTFGGEATINGGYPISIGGSPSYPTSATIQHSTFGLVAANQIYADAASADVSVVLQNNVFTSASSFPAFRVRSIGGTATFTSLGGNVFASNIASNLTLLASDRNNVGTAGLALGSLTALSGECIPTIPLGCFSQAIDAAVSSTLTTDVRGVAQIGAARDAGAYESTLTASASFTVTSLADDGVGTLRQVLADIGASSCPGPFTVTFGLSGTINLATGITVPATKDILILGPSSTATDITLNGGGPTSDFSILTIPTSATLTAKYLAFTNGHTSTDGGAILLDGGTMRLAYCYFYENTADHFSGAVHQGSGSFTITNSTFASNTAVSNGGAIVKFVIDPALIDNCTFSGNVGRVGGAVEGGIGSLTINNSTFTQNQAVGDPNGAAGGAIYGGNDSYRVTINNCLIAGNTSLDTGPDLVSRFDSNTGYNLIGNTSDATLYAITTGNVTGVTASAVLNPTLASNGGPTATHALVLGGPAYNAGPTGSTDADQRGLAVFGGRRDIGAFESQSQALTATVGSVSGLCAGTGGFSLSVSGGSGSGYQYRLTNAGSFSVLSGSSPYTVTVSTAGNFTVTVQDGDGNLSNAIPVTITTAPTSPTVSSVLACGANSATLTASCSVGTVLWSTTETSTTIVVPATALVYSASCVTSNCTSAGSSLTLTPITNSFTVTSTADNGPGTLRETITIANANVACGPFLITLPTSQTIALTAALPDILFSGTIAGGSTLCPATGVGGSTIARTGSGNFRLLTLAGAGETLVVVDVSLLNGLVTDLGGAIRVITNRRHNLTVQRCVFRTNQAGSGSGIYIGAQSHLIIEDSYFDENSSSGGTGAIGVANDGRTVRIERTTFRQVAPMSVSDASVITLIGSSSILIQNCTFGGGATINQGYPISLNGVSSASTSVTIQHNTFGLSAQNLISANSLGGNLSIALKNNIFTTNSATAFRIFSNTGTVTITSLGGNVFASNITSNLTLLASDRNNVGTAGLALGSLTALSGECIPTIPLGCFSQAIDAAVSSTLTTDVRGVAQIGAARDAGAYESTLTASASFTVTSLADAGAGSLRQTLDDISASSCPGPFTVTFGLSGTINLASGLSAPTNKAVLILGPSSTTTAITLNGGGASSNFSILNIPGSATLAARYLAFTNGHTANGGAINLSGGTLLLANCYLYGNSATSFGGAMYQGGGSFTITNSTFASNTATSNGGAIEKFVLAPGLIDNCTFSGNVGRAGGAIEAGVGSLTISNSTFTQNRAVGIASSPTDGAGGAIYGGNGSNRVTINNCLIAGNTTLGSGPDLVAGFNSNIGYNLIGINLGLTFDAVTTGNQTGIPIGYILLPTLANNGGSTPTHAIQSAGPAYNAGPPTSTDADQRGLAPFGGRRDIGAFESQVSPLIATVSNESAVCGEQVVFC